MIVGESYVNITINNMKASVPENLSILEAAKTLDIYIPTLCYLEDLSPSGACRLCIVEISQPERDPEKSWIDSACVCPVSEGLSIQTESPTVIRERKLILELLLSRAPDSKQIKDMAQKYGIVSSRFTSADEGESNCILCGLCIRVCNELIKANAIGTAHRGVQKKVTSPYQIAGSLCIGCLACVEVCPTGVIEFEFNRQYLKKDDWGVNLELSGCSQCGKPIGTKIQIDRIGNKSDVSPSILSLCPACRRKKNYSFVGV